ncbi:MAG: ABC transporter permease [Christensenellales bacterium]
MRKLTVYLKNYKKEMTLGPIFKLTEAVFELIVPLVMARMIDVGIANKDSAYILKMGGLLFILGICGLACALTCQYFAARCSQGFGTELRNAFFKHINSFPHQELDALGTASLITRITSDINQAQLSVAMMIRLVIRSPFLVVGAIVMATAISLRLSVFFLLAALGTAVVLYVILHTTVPLYRKIQQRLDHVGRLTREQLSGARVIRAFSRQEDEQARLAKASGLLKASAEKAGRISALLNPLTYVIINGTVLLVLWFGGIQVNAARFPRTGHCACQLSFADFVGADCAGQFDRYPLQRLCQRKPHCRGFVHRARHCGSASSAKRVPSKRAAHCRIFPCQLCLSGRRYALPFGLLRAHHARQHRRPDRRHRGGQIQLCKPFASLL